MSKISKIEPTAMTRRRFIGYTLAASAGALAYPLLGGLSLSRIASAAEAPEKMGGAGRRVVKSNEEWKQLLSPEEFYVLRKKGTERPFTGEYVHNEEEGVYHCAACDNELFSSKTKYDSRTGWPSFWAPIAPENILEKDDSSFFMRRTEVLCAVCDGHLGHVFNDGPPPTHLRYCINSVALKFEKKALS